MSFDAEYLYYRLANMPVNYYPFPHWYAQELFAPTFYAQLCAHLPSPEDYISIARTDRTDGAYQKRHIVRLHPEDLSVLPESKRIFWTDFSRWLLNERLALLLLERFRPFIEHRLKKSGVTQIKTAQDALLVRDNAGYSIGPHTDAPHKLMTVLFYLPQSSGLDAHGTSIYVPKQAGVVCEGGPHYPFDRFERVYTAPFLSNSVFGFVKTDNSFHGVEPIKGDDIERDLLIYTINWARG